MADSLYLSLWFSDFSTDNILAHTLSVARQFPFSRALPAIAALAVHPVSWNEATILEQQFRSGAAPEEAITVAADLIHDDYAYVFEANWDLWTPGNPSGEWVLAPAAVRFIVRGEEFEEGEAKTQGDIQVDFGLDTPFLHEELQLSPELESRVRANVQLLVTFIEKIEKNTGTNARLLWSESDQ